MFEKKRFHHLYFTGPRYGADMRSAVPGASRMVWFEAPWIGWSLATAIVLIVSAIIFEHNRTNPLLNTRWLSSGSILRSS